MKYIFDNLYTIIPDNEKYIVYCGNLRKAIRLSYSKMYIYKTIVENQSLMQTEEMLSQYGISKEEYESFTKQMLEKNIFFISDEEFKQEDFCHKYKKIIEKSTLLKAYLHVTQRCNLNCYYCYNKKNLNNGRKELSAAEWRTVILDLYSEGVRDYVITGGEPTIRGDLEEILSYIPKDCKVSILTNGTLLKEEKLRILEYANEVIVSLDSLKKENNESNRKNSINYNILSNIENLSEEQKKKIVVRTVITKYNIEDVAKLKRYVQDELKIKYITTGYLPNSKKEFDEFIPTKNEANYKLKMNNLISCGACSVEIALDSNGDIYPCQSLIKPEFKMGNISEENWKSKIIEKKGKAFHPTNINEIEKCKDCVYKYFCGNGCRAITYNIYHDINRCNDYFCEFYKEKAKSDIKKLFTKEQIKECD